MFFNVDAGEGFNNEHLLFPYVDAVNISCGSHAGDLRETENVILLAKQHGVKIGAHPSYPDKENFGRRVLPISHKVLKKSLRDQLSSFFKISERYAVNVHHVKPHGALYHQVATDNDIAILFFDVLKELNFSGGVMGMSNTLFPEFCDRYGVEFLAEAFADRQYEPNGALRNRTREGAVLSNQDEINHQVKKLLEDNHVLTKEGFIKIEAKTICFHGDHVGSETIIKNVRSFLGQL